MSTEQSREAFEAWYASVHGSLPPKYTDTTYDDSLTTHQWEAWQAAQSAPKAEGEVELSRKLVATFESAKELVRFYKVGEEGTALQKGRQIGAEDVLAEFRGVMQLAEQAIAALGKQTTQGGD